MGSHEFLVVSPPALENYQEDSPLPTNQARWRMPHAAATPAGHSSLVALLSASEAQPTEGTSALHFVNLSLGNAIAARLASVELPAVIVGDGDADNPLWPTVVTSDDRLVRSFKPFWLKAQGQGVKLCFVFLCVRCNIPFPRFACLSSCISATSIED